MRFKFKYTVNMKFLIYLINWQQVMVSNNLSLNILKGAKINVGLPQATATDLSKMNQPPQFAFLYQPTYDQMPDHSPTA